jgi:DNA-binding NtrC family response regulator
MSDAMATDRTSGPPMAPPGHHSGSNIIYRSHSMHLVVSRLERAAKNDVDVLITGETGTGKELAAEYLASCGKRSAQAPIRFNCSSMPPTLQQSQLLGFRRGAFTGAFTDSTGVLIAAHNRVLILSDVQDMSLDAQATLRGFFDRRIVCSLGGLKETRVDVQIVATTNRELSAAQGNGVFRGDLYERLANFVIRIPPLRERREDIPVLVNYTLRRLEAKHGRTIEGLDDPFWAFVQTYPWPGNVRELENVLVQAALETDGNLLTLDAVRHRVSHDPRNGSGQTGSLKRVLYRGKPPPPIPSRTEIEEVLSRFEWNIEQAADHLGIPLRTFYRLRRALGLA